MPPCDKLAAIVVLVLPSFSATGALIGVQIGEWLDWVRLVGGIGGGIILAQVYAKRVAVLWQCATLCQGCYPQSQGMDGP
jgi:hypothetical protein